MHTPVISGFIRILKMSICYNLRRPSLVGLLDDISGIASRGDFGIFVCTIYCTVYHFMGSKGIDYFFSRKLVTRQKIYKNKFHVVNYLFYLC